MVKGTIRWDRTTGYIVYSRTAEAIRPHVTRLSIAGSYRRGSCDLGDIDILVVPAVSEHACNAAFASVCKDGRLESSGTGLSVGMVPLGNGDEVSVNVFYTTTRSWGAALLYTTGSRQFNIVFRSIAKKRGLRVNQTGVFRGGRLIPDSGFSERAVCRAIGVQWLPPEARTGEYGPWVVDEAYRNRVKSGGKPARTLSSPAPEQPRISVSVPRWDRSKLKWVRP